MTLLESVTRTWVVRLALVLAAAVAMTLVPSAAQADHRDNDYCSPSGDYCTEVRKNDGVRLRIGSLAFGGRYRLCVTTPDDDRTCKEFFMRENDEGFNADSVRWARHFPTEGPGAYRVSWHKFGDRLGPVLGFHIR